MTLSPVQARVAWWGAAVSAAAVDWRTGMAGFASAVAVEIFEVVHARTVRATTLSFLEAATAGTVWTIESSGLQPAMTLQVGPSGPVRSQPDDKEGARAVPDEHERSTTVEPSITLEQLYLDHRRDLLSYAGALARNWADAEEAVSHAVVKSLEHHERFGSPCPPGRDPVAWMKTVISHYLIDRHRRADVFRRNRPRLAPPPPGDVADDVLDRLLADQAREFLGSLKPRAHMIAMLRWGGGLSTKEIAQRIGCPESSVRTSLLRTRRKIRRCFGITTEPQMIFREETP